MPTKLNIGDAWKTVAAININIGDVWKTVTAGWINVGDSWKQFHSPLLTWTGSTHTEADVVAAGGTVYTAAGGTIGRFTSATVPAGWTQAAWWQKYNIAGGTDSCTRFGGNAPTTFSNQTCTVYRPGAYIRFVIGGEVCNTDPGNWHWDTAGPNTTDFVVESTTNPSSYAENTGGYNPTFTTITRQEIGCY